MKILQIASHLNVGGVSSHVVALSQELARRGHQVVIASGGGQLDVRIDGTRLRHWPAPLHTSVEFSPQVLWASGGLAQRLQREPVDVVHGHTRVGQVVAASLAQRLGVPYITTWHGFFRSNLGRRLWPCLGQAAIAISDPVREHMIQALQVPEHLVRVILNGIDPAPFEVPVDPQTQRSFMQRLGIAPGTPLIGTMARLVASKGLDVLIRSLPVIRAAIPDAKLLIIGDGPHRAALAQVAVEAGVSAAVTFAGSLPEAPVALSLMDVFVFMPAEQEGFGLALLEAMAAARPIVSVRRGGGATWLLEHSGVGTIVPPDDPGALAGAIIRTVQDSAAAHRAAGQARALVSERYSLARMVDQVEDVYDSVAQPAAAAA